MKNVMLIFMLVMTTVLGYGSGPKLETVKIKTSAICEMCKATIEKKLAFTKGVSESNLNLDDKVVTVIYNPKKTDVQSIKKSISEAGYDADEMMADEKGYNGLPSCCKKDVKPHH
jgi:mercuric ion binding protein